MRGKAACERAFGALRSLLFEQLPGYTGVDVADRGADPEADAVLTMEQMERLVAEWVIDRSGRTGSSGNTPRPGGRARGTARTRCSPPR